MLRCPESEHPKLTNCEIIFEDFQPICDQGRTCTSTLRTDGRTTCRSNTARCIASHGNNKMCHYISLTGDRTVANKSRVCCTHKVAYVHSVAMSRAIKQVSDRVKPSFVIFDSRALWRSALIVRVPACQNYEWRLNQVWHRMISFHFQPTARHLVSESH